MPVHFLTKLSVILFLCLTYLPLSAQDLGLDPQVIKDIRPSEVIQWRIGAAQRYPNGQIVVDAQLITLQEFSIYVDKLTVTGTSGVPLKTSAPDSTKQIDPITNKLTDVYSGGDFQFLFPPTDHSENTDYEVRITFVGCTTRICLFPYTEILNVNIHATSEALPERFLNLSSTPPAVRETKNEEGFFASFEAKLATHLQRGEVSFLFLVLIVFMGGLLTNLTPCVAPMIPITVRILANQQRPPILNSILYAAGIMLTYTAVGIATMLTGSVFGTFMQSTLVNLSFALIMAFFALSMLNFVDLSFLQSWGTRLGAGQPSPLNTLYMGAGAGLVAAPCTGPILGALLAYSATRESSTQGVSLMIAYSLGFSLPYVFLGSLAGSVGKIRVNPALQLGSKLFFAAIMFGLCFYYLRIPAYSLLKASNPYLGTFTIVGILCSVPVILSLTLVKKLQSNKILAVLATFVLGFALFSGWQWSTTTRGSSSLIVLKNHSEALETARNTNKPVLIDNWAEWCEACKKMDVTTFADPEVITELNEHWILLKLDLTESTDINDAYMESQGIVGLPTLTILPPNADNARQDKIIGYVSGQTLLQKLQSYRKTLNAL